jgi:hypothetical protein
MSPKERDELLTRLDERMGKVLKQVETTNGRVTKLELWQAMVKGSNRTWMFVCSGMGVILGILATIATIKS